MTIRYTIGPFGEDSWRALAVSVALMHRLEPNATIHVTWQKRKLYNIPGVVWHSQDESLNVFGKYVPSRWAIDDHEVWLDNDHIMWALPPAWERFKARTDAALVWRTDIDYYGSYSGEIRTLRGLDWDASPGMFGLPPGVEMIVPDKRGPDGAQEELGGAVAFLARFPAHEYVWERHEVCIYHPTHDSVKGRDKIGTHGIHLMGMNREWNGAAKEMLDWVEREYHV